jgi:hypothetical protein
MVHSVWKKVRFKAYIGHWCHETIIFLVDYVGLCVEKILNILHALKLEILNFSGMQFNNQSCMLYKSSKVF